MGHHNRLWIHRPRRAVHRANTVTSVEIATLQGLTPDTTYHYRVVATNSAGTVTSADATFQTTALTLPQVALGRPPQSAPPPQR